MGMTGFRIVRSTPLSITWVFPVVAMVMLRRPKRHAEFTEAPVSQLRYPFQEHGQSGTRLRGDAYRPCIFFETRLVPAMCGPDAVSISCQALISPYPDHYYLLTPRIASKMPMVFRHQTTT